MKKITINEQEQYILLEIEFRRLESIQMYTNSFDIRTIEKNTKHMPSEVERVVEWLYENIDCSGVVGNLVESLLTRSKDKFKSCKNM